MTDIDTIRVLTGNLEISDEFIAFNLDSMEDAIKLYCNLDSIPKGLKNTLLEMVALKVNANSDGANSTLGQGVRRVTSLTDGSQTVAYGNDMRASTFASQDSLMIAYASILDSFRKMKVGNPKNPYERR